MDVGFGADGIDDEVMSVEREQEPKSELDTDNTWDSATMSRQIPEAYQVWVHLVVSRVPRSLRSELRGKCYTFPQPHFGGLNGIKRFRCRILLIPTSSGLESARAKP